MNIKLYSIVFLVCFMTLCWKTSEATKCYVCTAWARTSDDIAPATCAGGKLDMLNETDREVYMKDCGSFGCLKRRLEYADDNGHDVLRMGKDIRRHNMLNGTDREVYVKDCGSFGCLKRRLEYADGNGHDDVVMYDRSCADLQQDEKCKSVAVRLGSMVECFCQTDFCNGAVMLHTHHAIIALVTSVLAVILSRRGHE